MKDFRFSHNHNLWNIMKPSSAPGKTSHVGPCFALALGFYFSGILVQPIDGLSVGNRHQVSFEKVLGLPKELDSHDESFFKSISRRHCLTNAVRTPFLTWTTLQLPVSAATTTKVSTEELSQNFDVLTNLPPIAKNNVRLYFCRHGQTENNRLRKVQGARVNPSLNDNGRRQAEALGRALRNAPQLSDSLPLFYHSPLKRAIETARISADEFPVDHKPILRTLASLKEVDFGSTIEGDSVELYRSRMVATVANWSIGKTSARMSDDGESGDEVSQREQNFLDTLGCEKVELLIVSQVLQRVYDTLDFLIEEASADPSRSVFAFSHSTFLRALLCTIQQKPLAQMSVIDQRNCCIDAIDFEIGRVRRVGSNQMRSLGVPRNNFLVINECRHLPTIF